MQFFIFSYFQASGGRRRRNTDALKAELGVAVGDALVARYNVMDNTKKFNMMDIIQKVMDIAENGIQTYFEEHLGFDPTSFDPSDVVPDATKMANFFTQKIVTALEQTIPQISSLHYKRKDVTRVVAIYNNSPLANGFAGIPGTGSVETIIKDFMSTLTSIFQHIDGTDQEFIDGTSIAGFENGFIKPRM